MTTLIHHRPALLAQVTRRKVEGLGVVVGQGASHPPTSAGWKEIPNGSAYLALALRDGAYRGAYSQSREVPMVGVGGMRILWKSWQNKGLGYAQSRMPNGAMATVYRFDGVGLFQHSGLAPNYGSLAQAVAAIPTGYNRVSSWVPASSADMAHGYGSGSHPANGVFTVNHVKGTWSRGSLPDQRAFLLVTFQNKNHPYVARNVSYSTHTDLAGPPDAGGLAGLESRLAPYMDDSGTLDVARFGIGDPGLADFILGLGPNPASNPDWSRWAAMPVKPPVNDPRWAALTTHDLEHMQRQQGWAAAVATAQQSGDPRFQFRRKWYEVDASGYKVLTGGMGVRTSDIVRAVAGTPGTGATKANFAVPPGLDATTASAALLNAVNALLVGYSSTGVPSEHTASSLAGSVQAAWNADPKVIAAGSKSLLDVDESYGPNTMLAVATVNGGSAPAVNTGTTPVPTTVVVNTSSTTAPSNWTTPLLIGAALVAAAGITTAAVMHTKKRRARRAAHHHTTHHHAYA